MPKLDGNLRALSFYGAFEITRACEHVDNWDVFGYGRSQPSPALSASNVARRDHTNLLRPGGCGLPKGWAMLVERIRALLSEPLCLPVRRFAATTSVQFTYNQRLMIQTPLLDLLRAPLQLCEPLLMEELVSFEMQVTGEAMNPLADLREYLRHGVEILTGWIYIEGVGNTPVF